MLPKNRKLRQQKNACYRKSENGDNFTKRAQGNRDNQAKKCKSTDIYIFLILKLFFVAACSVFEEEVSFHQLIVIFLVDCWHWLLIVARKERDRYRWVDW
jgi:hypothetical protein